MFPVEHGRALAAAIPGARLVEVDGFGHATLPRDEWPLLVEVISSLPAPRSSAGRETAASVSAQTAASVEVGQRVAVGLAEPRAAGRADRLAARPREVDQRDGVALVEADVVGAVGDHRHRRGPQDPDARAGQDDDRHERRRRLRPRQQRHRDAGGAEADEARQHAAVAVGEAAEVRAHRRLERAGGDERRADPGRAGAQLVEPQRREHVERAEHQPDEDDDPHPGGDPRIAQAGEHACASGCAAAPGPTASAAPTPAARRPRSPTAVNTSSVPRLAAAAPSTGPSSAPTIAAAIAEPISSPRRSRGAAPTSQPSAPAHDAAEPSPWTKRATSSTTMLFAKANAIEERDQQHEAEHDGRAHAEPRRHPAAGQRAEQRPRRVRRGEDPGAGLAEVELLDELGQQRDDRREEHRVDEDDRGGEGRAGGARRRIYAAGLAVAALDALAHHPAAEQQHEEGADGDEHAGVGGRQRVEPVAEVDDRGAQRDRADERRPREAPERDVRGARDVADEAVGHDRDQPRGQQRRPPPRSMIAAPSSSRSSPASRSSSGRAASRPIA